MEDDLDLDEIDRSKASKHNLFVLVENTSESTSDQHTVHGWWESSSDSVHTVAETQSGKSRLSQIRSRDSMIQVQHRSGLELGVVLVSDNPCQTPLEELSRSSFNSICTIAETEVRESGSQNMPFVNAPGQGGQYLEENMSDLQHELSEAKLQERREATEKESKELRKEVNESEPVLNMGAFGDDPTIQSMERLLKVLQKEEEQRQCLCKEEETRLVAEKLEAEKLEAEERHEKERQERQNKRNMSQRS